MTTRQAAGIDPVWQTPRLFVEPKTGGGTDTPAPAAPTQSPQATPVPQSRVMLFREVGLKDLECIIPDGPRLPSIKQRGKFAISVHALHERASPEIMFALEGFIPVYTITDWQTHEVRHTGYGVDFDEIDDGEDAPLYTCIFTQVDHGDKVVLTKKWERVR